MAIHTVLKSIFSSCNELICSDSFKMAYSKASAFTRSRKLSFQHVVYFILGASKKALSANLADFADFNSSLNFPHISKQAFSQARKKIHSNAFRTLFHSITASFYSNSTHLNTWRGLYVLAVDGTSLQLPDTSQNRDSFGFIKNQHSPGRAIASASALFDVLNDIIIDAEIGRYGFSERKFAMEHFKILSEFNLLNSVITFDRGYPSQMLFHEMNELGLKFIIRAASSYKLTNKMTEPDSFFMNCFQGKSMTLRCICLTLPNGASEQLITNLLDPSLTCSDFSFLYFKRWGIEVKYKELKSRLQIEEFTGNLPSNIKQDFYATLFLSNLVAIAKKDVDACIESELTKNASDKKYQANRSFLISRFKYYLARLLVDKQPYLIEKIINEAKKVRSQIVPERSCERKTHLFKKNHYKNMKNCI